jgi:YHS domain-containing protein
MKLNYIFNTFVLRLSVAFSLALSLMAIVNAQDLTGIKCVINGKKAATEEASVEYKGGKVYFCCEHCADAFAEDVKLKDKAKHTIKANHQLFLTGQFVQKGCPMSGAPYEEEFITEVGGTKVGFCNEGCMNKVKNAENLEAKAKIVFSEAAFKRGFEKRKAELKLDGVKCILMTNKDVVADKSVDYKEGKVYFCCGGCAKKFSADPEKFTTMANHQLASTGQFIQKGCPISGGDVDDEESSVVAGVTVRFCCEKCKAKVDGAATDEAKIELVFGAKGFEKAFARN